MSDLVDIAANPVPPGAASSTVAAADGVRIRYARWRAGRSPRRGTVLILQGRAEFVEKYFETVGDLRRRGFAAATFDWRGQGGSDRLLADPRKGYVADFSHYLLDLDAVVREVLLPDCPPPYYVLGHSTGAAVALMGAEAHRHHFDKLILTAPLLRFAGSRARLARMAGPLTYLGLGMSYVPGGGATIVQTRPQTRRWATSDARRFQIMVEVAEARPALGLGSATIGWVAAAMRAARRLTPETLGPRLPMPVLMVIAGSDRVVSNRATEHLSAGLKLGAHVHIPGARHDLLLERDPFRDQFWAAFDAFIGAD